MEKSKKVERGCILLLRDNILFVTSLILLYSNWYMTDFPNKEFMDNIDIHYLYVNQQSKLDKIIVEKHHFEKCSTSNIITKEQLLQYIQVKRQLSSSTRYRLKDVMIHLVNLEGNKLEDFSKCSNISDYSKAFFKVLPIIDDIELESSLYLFHKQNAIYIVLQEMLKNKGFTMKEPLVSILKNPDSTGTNKKTKKVRIFIDNQ
jgi:hypothetical protein